jgi:hypothetical protein
MRWKEVMLLVALIVLFNAGCVGVLILIDRSAKRNYTTYCEDKEPFDKYND